MLLDLCQGPAREADCGVATESRDKCGESGHPRDHQAEKGVLFHTLLPDALGPLGLCGIKLVFLDLPMLLVIFRMVVDLETTAMVQQLVDD